MPERSRPRGLAADAIPCPGLTAARKARGLSQAEAAAELKVARTTWALWERRGAAPRGALERLAALWQIELALLLDAGETPRSARADVEDAMRDVRDATGRLSDALRRLLKNDA
jgi:transcriptional regulator with XRE-family HTH domain